MIRRFTYPELVCLLALALLAGSCNISKYIPKDEFLYTGAKMKPDSVKIEKSIMEELEKTTRPAPNASLFGMYPKVGVYYNQQKKKDKKGLFKGLIQKFGEPPVFISQVSTAENEKRISNVLFARGYLKSEVKHEVVKKKDKRAEIVYHIKPGTRYKIRNILFPTDSSEIARDIRASARRTRLKTGSYFDFDVLKNERTRIDNYLKERGYYFYIPEFILFRADSLHLGTTDLYLTLIDETPEQAKKKWTISDISIYGNYTLERDSIITRMKGRKDKSFTIVDRQERYKTDLYNRTILLKEGQLYQKSLQTLTVERLMNLQNFRFVRTVFFPDSLTNTLRTRVYLTPAKKRTVRFEVSGETKSNNFLGSSVGIRYRNLNLFKGAEILEAKINAGYDFQVGGTQQSSQASTLNGDISLFVPKFLPYLPINTRKNPFMPRTFFTLGAEYIRRPDQYTMRSFKFSTGYHWKSGKTIEHELKVLNINSIAPSDITPSFDSILNKDPALKASFEKQLVIGSKYQFTYNNTHRRFRKFNYIFDFQGGTSGNLFNALAKQKVDTPGAIKVGGVPVAQFVKGQVDIRGYLRLNKRTQWVNRVIVGAIGSYGNSVIAPYNEQFAIGGSSSIRAFRIRTLGPGSYHSDEAVYEANESGEFKVETNTELRYDLWKFIKLGAFIDAGNIWFFEDVPGKPGSGLDGLFKEMAVGAGVGVRFDVNIFSIRFDLAIPLRKPWLPEGERWVFDQMKFGDKAWRKDNLVLNIGIGYPF
ncbi:MAG TPA: BamA/TamA family outer membrane protein [Chitinophagaceae bacterium]|nr:BamA/TamA family outer membrane protein [Chitinophagaceae bacterium]